MKHPDKDLSQIKSSTYFDAAWYKKTYLISANKNLDPAAHYFEIGANQGNDPSTTFSTNGYLSAYPDVKRAGINPLLHFLKAGMTEGRSPMGILKSGPSSPPPLPRFGTHEYGPIARWLDFDRKPHESFTFDATICVHLHLFHQEMWDELLNHIRKIPVSFTFLLSHCGEAALDFQEEAKQKLPNAQRIVVRSVCNKGRDVAPWVVGFADEILNFDILFHFHSKKSDYKTSYSGWRRFLIHQTIGSQSIIEQILGLFSNDAKLGLVAPPYFSALPNQPQWGANRDATHELLKIFGYPINQDECPDFPAGSFFWARVKSIAPLLTCGLSYDDFEEENGQLDGTLGHAIERALGILPKLTGYKVEITGTDVAYNLINYWDSKRAKKLESNPITPQHADRESPPMGNADGRNSLRVALIVCVTGGFDHFSGYPAIEEGVDYFYITDHTQPPHPPPQNFKWMPSRYIDPNPRRTARFVKTHPQLYAHDYEYVVWIDANIIPLGGILPYVTLFRESRADLGVIAHPIRSSWLDEAQECIRIKADDPKLLQMQIDDYKHLNTPHANLIETNILISQPKNPKTTRFFASWWAEICKFSLRDQVSINTALAKADMRIFHILPQGHSVRDSNGFLMFSHDVGAERESIMRHAMNAS